MPHTQPRKRRNSSKVNLIISFGFHSVIVLALFYFAAREGLLGKQLKKIAVEIVKEKPPEKEKEPEPEKPPEPTPVEPQKIEEILQAPPPQVAQQAPQNAVAAPPSVAPPSMDVASFVFEGGKAVQSTSDPVEIYRGLLEYSFRSKWDRPVDIADNAFIAEVEISVDKAGKVSSPEWKRGSGNTRWDESVRQAIASTKALNRPPPTNFPARVLVRFDVQEVTESLVP